MKSTDNNINNPMRISEIDISKMVHEQAQKFLPVTQDFYDRMSQHDPLTTYYISDSSDHRCYIGDCLLPQIKNGSKYVMGIEDGGKAYVIYLVMVNNYDTQLIPICRYDDPQKAVNELYYISRLGYGQDNLKIHNALTAYISKEMGINETIISIIASKGYRDDPRLQRLNEEAIRFGVRGKDRDLPVLYREALSNMRSNPTTLFRYYADIYNVFVLFEFFTDRYYTDNEPEDLDLEDQIRRINDIFNSDC